MKDDTRYTIVKLLPSDNIYIRSPNGDGTFFYDKSIGLALVEWEMPFYGKQQGLHYLCRSDVECLDLSDTQNPENIFFYDELPLWIKNEKNRNSEMV